MSDTKKPDTIFAQVFVPVFVALLTASTAPWWFEKVHPDSQPLPGPTPSASSSPSTIPKCIGLRYLYLPSFPIYEDQPPYDVGIVVATRPGYSADKAGLKRGDTIISINGQSLKATGDIEKIISKLSVGDIVHVRLIRPSRSTINESEVYIYPPYQDQTFEVSVDECYP